MLPVPKELLYAWRSLKSAPASALAAIAILAIGLGCNTAIHTLTRGLSDTRPAGRHADEVYIVGAQPMDAKFGSFEMFDSGFVETLEQRLESFETLARVRPTWLSLSGLERAVGGQGIRAGKGFLSAIGVEMARGRAFRDEDFAGGEPVAVITHEAWRATFGGREDIVDSIVNVNGVPHRVVGVLPDSFSFERWRFSVVVASAYLDTEHAGDNPQFTWLVGRLKPGATPEQAQLELSALEPQVADLAQNLGYLKDRSLRIKKLNTFENSFVEKQARLLIAIGAVVLIISAFNVASLALARLSKQGAELATRFALGASRWDVARLALWENGIVALASYILGLGVGTFLIQFVSRRFAGASWGLLESFDGDASLHGSTLAATAIACVVAVALISATTAAFGSRKLIGSFMKQDSRSATSSAAFNWITSGLLFLEIAFTCGLLIIGGFFFASLERIRSFEYGYDIDDIRLANVNLPFYRFSDRKDAAELIPMMDAIAKRVAALPGIESVSLGKQHFPHRGFYDWIRLPDTPPDLEGARLPQAWKSIASHGYFELIGLKKLAGELFDETGNRPDAEPTIVINEAFARAYFPNGDAIGQFVESDLDGDVMKFRIIGIVSNTRRWWRANQIEPTFYFANANDRDSRHWANIYMRSDSWTPELERLALETIASFDREIIADRVENVAEEELRNQSSFRFIVFMQAIVGGIGFVLSCAGIYSSVSYAIERQKREIGVRLALGATPQRIRNGVLARSCLLAAPAITLGAGLALALLVPIGAFREQLMLVEPTDWRIYAAGCGALLAVSVAASWLPARRAARIEPNVALQDL